MKNKLYLLLLLIITIPSIVFADNRVIDGNEFEIYQRSKEEILSKWNTWGIIDSNVTKYSTKPLYTSPYRAGVLTQNYLNEVNDNLNYYRYLVGVPLTTKIPTSTVDLQTAEVIEKLYVESKGELTHHLNEDFPKPSDMSDEFYNLGANADNNIVSYAYNRQVLPNYDFFNESYFTETAGHRTTILTPELSYMEYGIGDNVVFGRSNKDNNQYSKMTNSYAAYPAPGYFPKQDFASVSDWDIYLNIKDFATLSTTEENNVVVAIANKNDGIVEYRTVADDNLYFENDWGYYRILIEQPTKVTNYYEGEFIVHVTNLKTKDGEFVDLEYNVNFFDKYEDINSNVYDFEFDLNLMNSHYDGEYNEQLINKSLKGVGIQVYLESGAVFYDKITRYNIKNIDTNKYRAFADITLPPYAKDPNKLISNYAYINVMNYPSNKYHYAYNDTEYNTKIGKSIKMSIKSFTPETYPNSNGQDAMANFFWFKDIGDNLTILDTTDRINVDNAGRININNVSKKDEGTYYAVVVLFVPYTYNNQTIYQTDYYFSKPITLTVEGMKGDMNNNGKIDLPDIIMLLKSYLGMTPISDNDKVIGDMNDDGSIGLQDIIILLRTYLGLE